MILAGNGSDDLLTIITRAFVGPGDVVVYPTPSYILYRTLAELQDARLVEVPFAADWTLDPDAFAVPGARLAFLANPNSPSGTVPGARARSPRSPSGSTARSSSTRRTPTSPRPTASAWSRDHPNVIVTRSFSKGYSLAGLRLGYLIARPEVVEGLIKVKDSYNCDTLSLVGGAAALEDRDYLAQTPREDPRDPPAPDRRRPRAWATTSPRARPTSSGVPAAPAAVEIYQALKDRKILVRLMRYPGHRRRPADHRRHRRGNRPVARGTWPG